MKFLDIIAIVLIIIGALINFVAPIFIKKKITDEESQNKAVYLTKSFGLVLVIIGCIIFFWLGGKFGV